MSGASRETTGDQARGLFITFEGIEGSGKSTVARLLGEKFREEGLDVVMTREPGGTRTSEDIRKILLDPERGEISPRAELLMYLAARAQIVSEVIQPALESGRIVFCDRFMDASTAYQGYARDLGEQLVEDLNTFAVGEAVPDLTFLFDLPVETGFSRGPDRREADGVRKRDRLERETRDFHERVREGYLRAADRHRERFIVVDAEKPLEEVVEEVMRNIRARLNVQS